MDTSTTDREAQRLRADVRLDEALEESFPASDPVAINVDVTIPSVGCVPAGNGVTHLAERALAQPERAGGKSMSRLDPASAGNTKEMVN